MPGFLLMDGAFMAVRMFGPDSPAPRVAGAAQMLIAAHAAAREVADKSAIAVARAAGHAVATAHFADHCLGLPLYALKAVGAAGLSVDAERAWQVERLPEEVRVLVTSALERRRIRRGT